MTENEREPAEGAEPDDSEPSSERQAELREAFEANVTLGKPPYAGVVIRTRGELNWMVKERGWRTGGFDTREQRIDLRNVGIVGATFDSTSFSYANLSGAELIESSFGDSIFNGVDLSNAKIGECSFSHAQFGFANLSHADLTLCTFSDAELGIVNLKGASIFQCTFSDAILVFSDLSRTFISGCSFSGARLGGVNLSGANITGDFRGADMTQARMDSATLLGGTNQHVEDTIHSFQLDEHSRLLDVAWNGAILANVRWERLCLLGDETTIKEAESRKERVDALHRAARAYRGLAKALQVQGLASPALRYRSREQQLERLALLYSFAIGPWIFSWLLNVVSGYGDRPGRALACYLVVVGAFTGAYWAITNQVFGFIQSHSAHLAWYEALVLSISSFHGRGFFPSMLSLGDPIALVAAAEAIIGLFIELVFITTFTQRFFAR